MLLVGSQAARFHYPDARSSACFDIWTTAGELRRARHIDEGIRAQLSGLSDTGEAAQGFSWRSLRVSVFAEESPEAHFIRANCTGCQTGVEGLGNIAVASPHSLYLIKRSHIHSPQEWHKHILDMHFLAEKLSESSPRDEEEQAFAMRLQAFLASEESFQSMQISDAEFFDRYSNAFIRIYPHDSLHQATCYYEQPLYITLKKDPGKAYISQAKFEQLSQRDKIRLVREEAYVLALERVVIPLRSLGRKWSREYAFQYALRELCTTAARGWFRTFAVENYPEICAYDSDFYEVFSRAEESGFLSRMESDLPEDTRLERVRGYIEKLERKNRFATLSL